MKSFILIYILIFCSSVRAFLNIESLRQSDKMGTYGAAGIKAAGASGNTEKMVGQLNVNIGYETKKYEQLILSSYKYGTVRNVRNTNKGSVHYRFTKFLKPSFSGESYVQFEFDEFRKIKFRKVVGLGVRARLLKKSSLSLFHGVGVFYENQDVKDFKNEKSLRGNFYLSFRKIFEEKFESTVIFYHQPSLRDFKDYRTQVVFGLEYLALKNLTLNADLTVAHDSLPVGAVEKTDISYMTGLSWRY